jgi:hypothetical protein
VQDWCNDSGLKLNLGKTAITSFTPKKNSSYFNYKLCNNMVLCSHCFKDLGVLLDSKLYFCQRINYIFSQGLKMLSLIWCILSSTFLVAFWFCTVPSFIPGLNMHLLSGTPSSVLIPLNSDSSKLEKIQRKFVALCYTRFLMASVATNMKIF